MKKDENSQALLLHCRCNYTHFVIGYNNIILLCHFYRDFKLYKNLSYPFIIEGDLKKKGSKFMLRRPDLGMLLFYELIESTIVSTTHESDSTLALSENVLSVRGNRY